MSVATSQQIARYYERFQNIDVTFNKQVIAATGLDPDQTFFKVAGMRLPCVIFSSSMVGARIISNITPEVSERIHEANDQVQLRFSFNRAGEANPIFFFVTSKVAAFTPYRSGSTMSFVTVDYNNRPSDDLIEILGELLQVNIAAKRRREERIVVTTDVINRLGLEDRNTMVLIQGVPRNCIIRDISFGGAKVLLVGVAKFLLDQKCTLKISLKSLDMPLDIPGQVLRVEEVEGRPDIVAVAIKYDSAGMPMSYKTRLNQYLQKIQHV